MKPFHTYRDGLPPGPPGLFATSKSIDRNGTPVRIGDIVTNDVEDGLRGVIVGIYDSTLVYLVDESGEQDDIGDFMVVESGDALIIGHSYNVLQEVVRIEALARSQEAP